MLEALGLIPRTEKYMHTHPEENSVMQKFQAEWALVFKQLVFTSQFLLFLVVYP
jgi:hypothetical protein